MAGLTAAQAQTHLDAWIAADIAVATGQSYTIGSRRLDRTNAREIRENITFWDGKVKSLSSISSGGIRVRGITPV